MDKSIVMTMPKINKNILLVGALIVVGIAGYFIFAGGSAEPAPLTEIQSGSSSQIGQEIVIELNRLKSLQNINGDLFKNSAFVSLKDFTQIVVPQSVGRSNPFAPIGN